MTDSDWADKQDRIREALACLVRGRRLRAERLAEDTVCVVCGAIPEAGSDECPKCQKQIDKGTTEGCMTDQALTPVAASYHVSRSSSAATWTNSRRKKGLGIGK